MNFIQTCWFIYLKQSCDFFPNFQIVEVRENKYMVYIEKQVRNLIQ